MEVQFSRYQLLIIRIINARIIPNKRHTPHECARATHARDCKADAIVKVVKEQLGLSTQARPELEQLSTTGLSIFALAK